MRATRYRTATGFVWVRGGHIDHWVIPQRAVPAFSTGSSHAWRLPHLQVSTSWIERVISH
jgi:hypothetical protein